MLVPDVGGTDVSAFQFDHFGSSRNVCDVGCG